MKMVTLCRLWSLFLLACASLWGSARLASAQPIQMATIIDVPETHFVDHWMRANAALITAHAQQEIRAGRVRPSFSSTLNPVRYGLVDRANRHRIVGPLDLLCLNRANHSLILACRSRTTGHERFVHLSSRACRDHRPLSAILPTDCEHPYVITRTGRAVTVPNSSLQQQTISAPRAPTIQATREHRAPPQQSPEAQTTTRPTSPITQPPKIEQTNVNMWILFLIFLLSLAYVIWKMTTAGKKELKERMARALEERDAAREELAQASAEHQRTLEEKTTQERVLKERDREIQQLRDMNTSRQRDVQAAQDTVKMHVLEKEHLRDQNKELERQLYQVVDFTRSKGVRLPSELTAFVPTQPPPTNFKVSPPRGTLREIRETYPHELNIPRMSGAVGASNSTPRRDTPPGTVAIVPHESTQPQMFLPEAQPSASSKDDSFMLLLNNEELPLIDKRSMLNDPTESPGDRTRFFNAEHLQGSFVTVPTEDRTVSHTPTKQLLKDACPSSHPPSVAGPVMAVKSMKFPTVVVDERKMAERARDSLTVPSTFPPRDPASSQDTATPAPDEVPTSFAIKPPPADLVKAVQSAADLVEENSEHSGPRLLTPLPPDKQQRR